MSGVIALSQVPVSICSLLGGITIMCVKGVSTGLILSLQGDNQLSKPIFWAFLLAMVFTLICQIRYLNKAMASFGVSEVKGHCHRFMRTIVICDFCILLKAFFSALCEQVVPVYYVCFTMSSIMMGFILYREFSASPQPLCYFSSMDLSRRPSRMAPLS
jgi:hypothetical protein